MVEEEAHKSTLSRFLVGRLHRSMAGNVTCVVQNELGRISREMALLVECECYGCGGAVMSLLEMLV